MKYILIPSLLVLSMAAHATLPKTEGIYMGLGVVYAKPTNHLSVATTNLTLPNPRTSFNTVKTSTDSTFTGRLLGGYHIKCPNNTFLEGELFGQLADPQQKTPTVSTVTLEKLALKLRRNWTIGAALKPGYYFNDVFGGFLSIGLLYSQFKTTAASLYSSSNARSSSQRQKAWGGSAGVGFIYQATDSILLKAEYAHERYKKFKTHPLQSYFIAGGSNINNVVTSKVRYNTFVVSASYLF